MAHIQCSQVISAPPHRIFEQLRSLSTWQELLAAHVELEVLSAPPLLEKGDEFQVELTRFGLAQNFRFLVEECSPSKMVYRQLDGIFKHWLHRMTVEAHGPQQSLVTDRVDYSLPLGLFGHLANDLFFREDLVNILQDRLDRLAELNPTSPLVETI